MEAILDNYYVIEVLDNHPLLQADEIRIAYNSAIYPDLYDYLLKKILKKQPVVYKDEQQELAMLLKEISSTDLNTFFLDDDENEDIAWQGRPYGVTAINILTEKRRAFVDNRAHGTIRVEHIGKLDK